MMHDIDQSPPSCSYLRMLHSPVHNVTEAIYFQPDVLYCETPARLRFKSRTQQGDRDTGLHGLQMIRKLEWTMIQIHSKATEEIATTSVAGFDSPPGADLCQFAIVILPPGQLT